jgi:hypothetical protein
MPHNTGEHGQMNRNFKRSLNAGFAELRKRGYFAKQKWYCCGTCGVAAIPDDVTDYVFYTLQAAERMAEKDSVYLSWNGDGMRSQRCFAVMASLSIGMAQMKQSTSKPPRRSCNEARARLCLFAAPPVG